MNRFLAFVCLAGCFGLSATSALAAKRGVIEIKMIDSKTREPLTVRMHVKDQKGKPVKPPKAIFWHDHFVVDGSVKLELPTGNYTFEVERGLEYKTMYGK